MLVISGHGHITGKMAILALRLAEMPDMQTGHMAISRLTLGPSSPQILPTLP